MSPAERPTPEALRHGRAYLRVDREAVDTLPGLAEAIDAFRPVPGPAGESVGKWLKERALSEPQEAAVRVRLNDGRVTGVYALCAAQIALSREERSQLGGVYYRTQPAILIAQFARSAETPGIGDEMMLHADATARRALHYIGATTLVVDPFDEDTAEMWRSRFGFQNSEQPVPGNRHLRRQWLSLQS